MCVIYTGAQSWPSATLFNFLASNSFLQPLERERAAGPGSMSSQTRAKGTTQPSGTVKGSLQMRSKGRQLRQMHVLPSDITEVCTHRHPGSLSDLKH